MNDITHTKDDARAIYMDWEQVRLNGGPPCFALGVDGDPKHFCGRAERWVGHGSSHEFISLQQFLEGSASGRRLSDYLQTNEIDSDLLRGKFERIVNLLCSLDMKYTFTTEEHDTVLQAIEEAELSAASSGWRDVKDGLPTERGEYLISVDFGDTSSPFVELIWFEVERGRLPHGDYTKAWMPKPEPYQSGE